MMLRVRLAGLVPVRLLAGALAVVLVTLEPLAAVRVDLAGLTDIGRAARRDRGAQTESDSKTESDAA